jgi:DNA-binding MarR family transcriptional regulator
MQPISNSLSFSKRKPPSVDLLRNLASFRYSLRKFLRFSEKAARQFGVTPQQHQLMLGVAGYTDRGNASISELAEFLQERHHSVVELVERAVQNGLVYRGHDAADRRVVIVSLTLQGEETLAKLTTLHQEEIARVRTGFLNILENPRPLEPQEEVDFTSRVSEQA